MAAEQPTVDVEFFLDPVCPWCWITSRWVTQVQEERNYTVAWRFISLYVINEDTEPSEQTRQAHTRRAAMPCASPTRSASTTATTPSPRSTPRSARGSTSSGRREEFAGDTEPFIAEALKTAGLDPGLAAHAHDESHDAYLREETELALVATGPDVGTPILTFAPGQGEREGSFFGPVISKAPRGEEAVKLWEAVETLATSGVAELKRSLRAKPEFD